MQIPKLLVAVLSVLKSNTLMKQFIFVKLTLSIALGVSFLLFGCKAKVETPAKQPEKIQVQEIDASQLREIILNNGGKHTIVNFWASWCIPCKEEMPALIKLRTQFTDKLNLILVAIDEKDSIESAIRPILTQSGVDFVTYIKQEGNDEEFINTINREWSGALPGTFIYDAQGQQLEMLTGGQSYEKFESAIKKYIVK